MSTSIEDPSLPERVLLSVMKTGVDTIVTDLGVSPPGETILDGILKVLDDAERTKARAIWTTNPPTVVLGYPREDHPFPIYALVLTGDADTQQYIGDVAGVLDMIDVGLGLEQTAYAARQTGTFTIFCYNEHPDLCAWMYRVMRKIMRVATRNLIVNGLTEPKLNGADMAPVEQYKGDILFVRRLTVTFEYNETWNTTDPLFAALNGDPEPAVHVDDPADAPTVVSVHHEDQVQIPGKVKPRPGILDDDEILGG